MIEVIWKEGIIRAKEKRWFSDFYLEIKGEKDLPLNIDELHLYYRMHELKDRKVKIPFELRYTPIKETEFYQIQILD